jgi:hypothetical protein
MVLMLHLLLIYLYTTHGIFSGVSILCRSADLQKRND